MSKRLSAALMAAGLLSGCAPIGERVAQPFDVLIANGTVYDGSLAGARRADIGVRGDRIQTVAAPADAAAKFVIDATGHAVFPGFIDPHTHARKDLGSADRNANANYLYQGVTTVVIGNDGDGVAERKATLDGYAQAGIGTNVAFFAGHGGIRKAVMGLADRAPTAAELNAMQELVDNEMHDGALGLSSGLFYAPGSYADTDEVVALARVAAHHGGIYDTHIRSESTYTVGLLGAIEEAIEIGRQANIPVHIAHIKALGQDVWGQSDAIIALVESARDEGLDVTADQYPWRASGTRFSNALIPRWAMADSQEAMQERLADPVQRAEIDAAMRVNLVRRGGPDAMLVTAANSRYRGMTLTQIAAAAEVEPIVAAVEAVLDGDPSIASFVMQARDIDAFAVQPWVMTGSDGSSGHPRKFGTYPKAYRDFVVDKRLLTIEQFAHRSSGLVADSLGLCDRGYLRAGLKADVAVVDLANFRPRATYEQPAELASGVTHLLVNGVLAIGAGERTDALAGTVVDKQRLSCAHDR